VKTHHLNITYRLQRYLYFPYIVLVKRVLKENEGNACMYEGKCCHHKEVLSHVQIKLPALLLLMLCSEIHSICFRRCEALRCHSGAFTDFVIAFIDRRDFGHLVPS